MQIDLSITIAYFINTEIRRAQISRKAKLSDWLVTKDCIIMIDNPQILAKSQGNFLLKN